MNIDEAIAIAKEYHLEAEVTKCINQGMSPIEALIEWDLIQTKSTIKLINNITQIIILLGCCAISIFILFALIPFIKDDFAAITNMYDYIRMQNITIRIDTILFTVIVISYLNRINNTIQI